MSAPVKMLYASDFVEFWESGERFLQACVKLIVATKKWKTVSCDVELPFVCFQLPPVPGNSTLGQLVA